MKYFILTLAAVLCFSVQGQVHLPGKKSGRSSADGVFGARFTAGMLHGDGAVLCGAALEPGILFSNRLMIQFSFGYMQNYHQANRYDHWFQTGTASVNFSMRLLNSNNILSPTLAISTGACFLSNVKRGVMEKGIFIAEDDFINTMDKMYSFARASYLLDIQYKQLNLRIGPNYSCYISQHTNTERGARFTHGIGLEIGVVHVWK